MGFQELASGLRASCNLENDPLLSALKRSPITAPLAAARAQELLGDLIAADYSSQASSAVVRAHLYEWQACFPGWCPGMSGAVMHTAGGSPARGSHQQRNSASRGDQAEGPAVHSAASRQGRPGETWCRGGAPAACRVKGLQFCSSLKLPRHVVGYHHPCTRLHWPRGSRIWMATLVTPRVCTLVKR